jgi:hypothetical protein
MRYLFVLPYPGFLRYFDSVIQELADRGHHVDLAWEKTETQQEALAAFPPRSAFRSHRAAEAQDFRRLPARRVRMLANYAFYLDRRFADAEYLRRRAAARVAWPSGSVRRRLNRLVRLLIDLFSGLERAIPRSAAIDLFIKHSCDGELGQPHNQRASSSFTRTACWSGTRRSGGKR